MSSILRPSQTDQPLTRWQRLTAKEAYPASDGWKCTGCNAVRLSWLGLQMKTSAFLRCNCVEENVLTYEHDPDFSQHEPARPKVPISYLPQYTLKRAWWQSFTSMFRVQVGTRTFGVLLAPGMSPSEVCQQLKQLRKDIEAAVLRGEFK